MSTRFTLMPLGILAIAPVVIAQGSGDLYTSVGNERLFTALAVESERAELTVSEAASTSAVLVYRLVYPNAANLYSLSLGLYDSHDSARHRCRFLLKVREIAPAEPPSGDPIGDEFYWWPSRPGAPRPSTSVVFRRRNMVVDFAREGTADAALAVARQIDALIRDDRAIAPLGTFDPPPEIVDAGLPARLPVRPTERRLLNQQPVPFGEPARAIVRINPQFRGLGPPEGLRLHVDIEGFGSNQVGPDGRSRDLVDVPDGSGRVSNLREKSAEHDGRFLLELRRLPSQPTTRKVRVTAANADNVIVTREFEVELVPAR